MPSILKASDEVKALNRIMGYDLDESVVALILDDYAPGWTQDEAVTWLDSKGLYRCAGCGCWVDRGQVYDSLCEDCQGGEA